MIELNSREWAIIIWLAFIAILILRKRDLRSSALAVLGSFIHWKILVPLLLAILWAGGCVWVLKQFGVWQWDNLKATIIWGLTFILVTMMDVGTSKEGVQKLRSLAKQTITATAVVVFIAEFYTFPLWTELILVPFLVLLGAMIAMAERNAEHALTAKVLGGVQLAVGLGLLGYSGYWITINFSEFATLDTGREFVVPILLSLMYLPFLYAFMVVIAYENAAARLHFRIEDKQLRRSAYLRGMLAFGPNIELFQRYIRTLNFTDTVDHAYLRQAIAEIRRIRRREKHPPKVDWSQGWSPYEASSFLADYGLKTQDYHRVYDQWSAEAPSIDINDKIPKDRIGYRIAGTETAATKLSLELHADNSNDTEAVDECFLAFAELLIMRALGDETAARFIEASFEQNEGTLDAGEFRIEWSRDDWGDRQWGGYARRLKIVHPAHHDPYMDG